LFSTIQQINNQNTNELTGESKMAPGMLVSVHGQKRKERRNKKPSPPLPGGRVARRWDRA
jgi:hypothetical protein